MNEHSISDERIFSLFNEKPKINSDSVNPLQYELQNGGFRLKIARMGSNKNDNNHAQKTKHIE
jgi:hypothetical protein